EGATTASSSAKPARRVVQCKVLFTSVLLPLAAVPEGWAVMARASASALVMDTPEILPILARVPVIECAGSVVAEDLVDNGHQPGRLVIRHLDFSIGRDLYIHHLRLDPLACQHIVNEEPSRIVTVRTGRNESELRIAPPHPRHHLLAMAKHIAGIGIVA